MRKLFRSLRLVMMYLAIMAAAFALTVSAIMICCDPINDTRPPPVGPKPSR